MQYKYTFLYKVFYRRILSARLLSDCFCSNFKRCLAQKNIAGDILMSQRSLQAEVLLSV